MDIESGKESRGLNQREEVKNVVFSPDGNVLASSSEYHDQARLWNVASGKELRPLAQPARQEIAALAFSPDGRFLAGAGPDSNCVVYVWEVLTGREAYRFSGHFSAVDCAHFSLDGRSLVSGGSDSMILIWDLTDGAKANTMLSAQELATLWDDLSATDSPRACKAVWRLSASPQQAVAFLKSRLQPVARLDDNRKKQIAQWIADLDAIQFDRRETASTELEKIAEPAVPILSEALKGKLPPEARRRAQELLDKLSGESLSADQLRRLRAIQTLEYCRSAAARQLLEALARGAPEARLTREAMAAIARMTRPAGTTP